MMKKINRSITFIFSIFVSAHTISIETLEVENSCGSGIVNNDNAKIKIVCQDPETKKALIKISSNIKKLNITQEEKYNKIKIKIDTLSALLTSKNNSNDSITKRNYKSAISAYAENDIEGFQKIISELTKNMDQKIIIPPIGSILGLGDSYEVKARISPLEISESVKCNWSLDGNNNVKYTQTKSSCTINIHAPIIPNNTTASGGGPILSNLNVQAKMPNGRTESHQMPVVISPYLLVEVLPSKWSISESDTVNATVVKQKTKTPISRKYDCEWNPHSFPVKVLKDKSNSCSASISYKGRIPRELNKKPIKSFKEFRKELGHNTSSNIYVNVTVFYEDKQVGTVNLQLRDKTRN